ncbi:MAG: choice-of-anchor M domain-containing protein [Verrucomicrobiota bacterium]
MIAATCLAIAAPFNLLQADSPSLDLIRGHYELQMDYDEVTGWWAGLSYLLPDQFGEFDFDDPNLELIRRVDPAALEIALPSAARESSVGTVASFLAPAGTPVWRIPQGFEAGNHFLGMRVLIPIQGFQTRIPNSNIYIPAEQGNISLRLLSISGTGPDRGGNLGVWQDGNGIDPPVIAFNSSNGIDSSDEVQILPPGTHVHYNWAFTQPGSYQVNMEIFGVLRDGTPTSHPFTVSFQVPHDGTPDSLDLRVAHDGNSWELLTVDLTDSVAYAEKHAYYHAATTSPSPGPTNPSNPIGWAIPFSFAPFSVSVADTIGTTHPETTNAPFLPGSTTVQLTSHLGPGHVLIYANDGSILIDSRDGLDSTDSFQTTETLVNGQLSFTDEGLHRLTFKVTNSSATLPPLTIRCGANLPANHTYAQWADSFERAYNLPTGTLSDPTGNFDNDCLPHQLEYLLDLDFTDPTQPDSIGQFQTNASSQTQFVFMRDLHKDLLNNNSPALFPSFSADLTNWETLDRINDGLIYSPALVPFGNTILEEGLPVGLHEIPVVSGNARSLFMKRSLSNPSADPSSGYFQLSAN